MGNLVEANAGGYRQQAQYQSDYLPPENHRGHKDKEDEQWSQHHIRLPLV
jgi:hypothetical protein